MVKIFLFSLLLFVPNFVLGFPRCLPRRHVQSTFDLNNHNDLDTLSEGLRLIQTSEEKPPEWMNQHEILTLFRNKIKFMDVTDYLELGTHYKFNLKHGKSSFFSKVKNVDKMDQFF